MARRRAAPPAIEERAFHRWVARTLRRARVGPLPVGDDTAAIPLPRARLALLTTDALTEGTHFLPRSPPRRIGAAAAAVSLSDIAAKGGVPRAFLLDLLLPRGTPATWGQEVLRGAEAALAPYGAHVVGGDTKPARTRAVVGTLLGDADPRHLAPRTGARIGDLVVVTGAVGRGGAAARGLKARGPPGPSELSALLDIRPRVLEGPVLARYAHAMLDSSDGLAESVHLLSESSRRRVVIEADRLPLHPQLRVGRARRDASVLRTAFYGGDYELVATLAPARFARAREALRPLGCPLTAVGHVAAGRGAWLSTDGRLRPMPRSGWQPFGRPRPAPA